MDTVTFWDVLRWTLCAIALSPIVVGIGWEIVVGSILPRLIPRTEIERLADEVIARFPDDPMRAAIDNEKTAWVKAESGEQAKWRRVGLVIRAKLPQGPTADLQRLTEPTYQTRTSERSAAPRVG